MTHAIIFPKIWIVTAVSIIFCSILACKQYHRNKSHAQVPPASIEKGRQLAQKYCQSCHAFPDPALLDAKTWEKGVLPHMGPMLGIFQYGFERYPSGRRDPGLKNFYPSKPVIGTAEWQYIIDYYTATSPDTLLPHVPEQVKPGLPIFQVLLPKASASPPATTFLKIVTLDKNLLLADKESQSLVSYNGRLEITDSLGMAGTIADIFFENDTMLICDMGQLNPNNSKFGRSYYAYKIAGAKMRKDSLPVLSRLARPVQITPADLDNDGLTDYVACEFGFMTGGLTWFRNMGNDSFQRQVLSTLPGPLKMYIHDYNRDGLQDLWVLFAQGEEGIFLFTNKGNGRFESEQLLRFSPVNGSTYFELVDFNHDGNPDILYTCGDNADYSPILKPYHGVYLFLNDGENHFTQKYFFPMNGCFKALAADFDKDGDFDIAAISFFADYARQPSQSFVYLENKGSYHFQPYSFKESALGRWLTMDAGDLDGDGMTDLVLGNFSIGPAFIKPLVNWKAGPPFVFLKNTAH